MNFFIDDFSLKQAIITTVKFLILNLEKCITPRVFDLKFKMALPVENAFNQLTSTTSLPSLCFDFILISLLIAKNLKPNSQITLLGFVNRSDKLGS
jgi:hypothetical protein